jgi:hypothetical protein
MYRGFEISIAFDDSCGTMKKCSRGDILIFKGNANETCAVMDWTYEEKQVIEPTLENLMLIKKKIDEIKRINEEGI